MCGIAGVFNLNQTNNISIESIKKMVDIQHHRGPDECGIYIDDNIALGHSRLSIIDLSSGIQPIHNEDKSLWIIFNGEVYNYPELKAELVNKGHKFYTTTDTEVILHLYEERGEDFLNELNGQFALAIWNSKKEELFLARDRVGIRPLHYTIQNGAIIFASEIKAIFTNNNISRKIDPSSINQIFTCWTPLPGNTCFEGIKELPSGHFLKISKDESTLKQYWEIPLPKPDKYLDWSKEKIVNQIREFLFDAIKIRLRADVPVGCYLSGGLDSSIISTLVSQNFNNDIRTFGIRFEEDEFDEGKYQNKMVSYLGTNHSDINITNQQIAENITNVLWHCETPLLRTGPIPMYLLSQLVTENNYKVVLTGEGADEIFGGYNIFREAKIRKFWSKYPDSKYRGLLVRKLYPYIFKDKRLSRMLEHFYHISLDQVEDPLFSHLVRWENTSKLKNLLSVEFRERAYNKNLYNDIKKQLPESFDKMDYFAKTQFLEMKFFMNKYLLSSQGDRVAMGNSLEIRVPFLDHRLIEFMSHVPPKLKISGLNEKYILKKTFEDIIPKEIIDRNKQPYRAPIAQSLLNNISIKQTKDILSPENIKNSGIFEPKKVNQLLDKLSRMENIGEQENMALISLFSTQIIYDKFIKNFSYQKHQINPKIFDYRKNAS